MKHDTAMEAADDPRWKLFVKWTEQFGHGEAMDVSAYDGFLGGYEAGKPSWAAIEDGLPDTAKHYLVRDSKSNPKHCVHIAYWSVDRQRWMGSTKNVTDDAANKSITHYMPIPPAPGGGDDND
jgi:hypothetical protein